MVGGAASMKMKLHKFFGVVCFLLVAFGYADETVDSPDAEEAVVTLTDKTLDDFVKENPLVVVEFYAPWCGHCKNLAPEYEKAAQVLKENDPPVILAKVDATEEKEVAAKFGVQGYPTLKFFRNGEALDYDGPRDASGIVSYLQERAHPDWKPPPEAVVTLTDENFEDFISQDLVLVEFYAPWCGHCKQLAPKYEAAAKTLKENSPPILLGKIDATEYGDLAKKYAVSGYPTMFVFRNGEPQYSSKDKIPREERTLVDYMRKQIGDAARRVKTFKELANSVEERDITLVGLFTSESSAALQLYQRSCSDLREEYTMLWTTDSTARDKYGIGEGREVVVVVTPELFRSKFERAFYVLEVTEETTSTDLLAHYDSHKTPLVGEKTSSNSASRYDRRPLCVLWVPVDWSLQYKAMTDSWRQRLLPLADKYRQSMYFAMSDDELSESELNSFGLEDAGSQFSIGCYGPLGEKYAMEELDEWEEDEVDSFLSSVSEGTAKPYLRSQIPPAKQKGPVKVVVGKTFKQIVLDQSKDVLIEFYAPWCGHCKKLEPEYKKLAKELKSEKSLVIAKMDATANDAPAEYQAQGYPTIYFAPANQKELPMKYEGERTLKAMKEFLKENSSKAFKKSKDEL